jgi:hypothetical protein
MLAISVCKEKYYHGTHTKKKNQIKTRKKRERADEIYVDSICLINLKILTITEKE